MPGTAPSYVGLNSPYFFSLCLTSANPPFNLKNWRKEDELTDDPRFTGFSVMPPVANANYAWILHMLSKLVSVMASPVLACERRIERRW